MWLRHPPQADGRQPLVAPSRPDVQLSWPQPVPVTAAVREAGFELPAHASSVGRARARVGARLRRWGFPEDLGHTAQLVISEFFTNAVLHTDSGQISCSLQLSGQRLRIEVTDEGTERCSPQPRDASDDEVNGRGLQLVSALAESWGVSARDPRRGRVVWAELGPQ
ncbi:ATP-binding protein [Streptomyces sp. SB3404]|uniref:ATP-binding protein n=2 Tax=Streptomyces boncukensis TaxID=2711219 RepID=A0A6G4WSX0_9ACTN|nr:ATP-binding protein [Streptomyces boncukensis]NGO67740.1 ATP-binding protein [Streptomyces boncukensis]